MAWVTFPGVAFGKAALHPPSTGVHTFGVEGFGGVWRVVFVRYVQSFGLRDAWVTFPGVAFGKASLHPRLLAFTPSAWSGLEGCGFSLPESVIERVSRRLPAALRA